MCDEINKDKNNNVFKALLNDDITSLDNFLQETSDENYGVDFCLKTDEVPQEIKSSKNTKFKLFSPTFYSYGDKIPLLSISALFGSVECFNFLLMSGADINLSDTNGRLPVHFACAGGNIEICDILDSAGANYTELDRCKRTCLHYACISGNISLVERLWMRNFDLEAQDVLLMQPIHFASIYNNELDEVDGTDIINNGGNEIFDFLLNKGCKLNSLTKDGFSPFDLAVRFSPCVLNYLIENCNWHDFVIPSKVLKKEDIKKSNDNNIMSGFSYNPNAYEDMLNKIHGINTSDQNNNNKNQKEETPKKEENNVLDLNNFLIFTDDEDDQISPLIDSCRKSNFGIAFALLNRNQNYPYFDIDVSTNQIVKIEKIDFIPNKIKNNVLPMDVNQKDCYGWSPILYAAERGCLRIVKLLVSKGADVNTTSKNGFSPLLASKNRNHPEIASFLEANGAKLHPS